MKKAGRYVLFMFIFISSFFMVSNIVKAEGTRKNVFDSSLIGSFEIKKLETGNFNRRSENYNYTFTYDYIILDNAMGNEEYITDSAAPIIEYYGFAYESGKKYLINYENIADGFVASVSDEFAIYKYNVVSMEFEFLNSSGKNPDAGTYEITDPGIYRLSTLIDGVVGRSTYVIYEPESVELKFDEEPFTISKNNTAAMVEINLIVQELKSMTTCYPGSMVKVGGTEFSHTCQISVMSVGENEKFNGYHNLVLKFNTTTLIREDEVVVSYNGHTISNQLAYDLAEPVVESFVYMNPTLLIDGFEINAKNENIIPVNSLAKIKIVDDSDIASVTMKYLLNEVETTTACTYSLETKEATCTVDATKIPAHVAYEIVDIYGNKTVVEHINTYDTVYLPEGDTIANHISITGQNVTLSFDEEYPTIKKICIFYGEELSNSYECGYVNLTASYYYKGTINIIAFDVALNYEVYKVENVEFLNGYEENDFTWEVNQEEGLNTSSYVSNLKDVACGSNSECKENVVVKAKYDDLIEVLESDTLPAYIDILNKKFKDSTCASGVCNKTVELIVAYNIGDLEQSVSGYLNYVDNHPYIKDTFTYINLIELEYKKFDIANRDIVQSLYGDNMEIVLKDDSYTYLGVIKPIFVEYVDRDGVTTSLENLPYTSIASANKFGDYLLECRIKLLKNITLNTVYQDDIYAKSFFIKVKLSDKDAPVITLIGEENMTVKQYGAYKEPGYRCEDASSCTVTVTYYLNDENQVVEGVDTNIIGKYIVKYTAVDGDGNEAVVRTRIINVESMNSFDATSIIVIVSIVVVLFAIVTIIVIIEVKKNKKIREKEEYI